MNEVPRDEVVASSNIRFLSDEELLLLHRNGESDAPAYFLRERYRGKLKDATDEMLNVFVQMGSEKAKREWMNRYKDNWSGAPDEVLVLYYQENPEILSEIVKEHLPFIKKTVKRMERKRYFKEHDSDDLVQEGVMGYFKAINDYKIERKTKFKDFARCVIERHLDTLIGKSMNGKNRSLNESFSYHSRVKHDSEKTFEDMFESRSYKPEESYLKKETLKDVLGKLTDLEEDVLKLYAKGLSYEEIGQIVGKRKKAIDNTIQRIRKKGKDYMSSYI